jgi:hypothetical protein
MKWMVAIAALLSLSCRDADVAAPAATAPYSAAKAASGAPTVSSTDPSYGRQGTIALDVRILGNAFDPSARASWQKNGQAYPKIVVNSTRYVSATELVANISIASDAAIDSYDVVVALAGGKPGIGTEMFTVTLAVSIDEPIGRAVNDAGQIVGQSGTDAALWDPTVGHVLLEASGLVWDIDRSGTYIGGKNAAGDAVVWTSSGGPAGPWVATTLPSLGNGSAVRGVASDAAGVAVLMVGNAFSTGSKKNPIVWTRTGTGWEYRIFPMPAGLAGGWGQAINPRGMVAGMDGSGCCNAVYWDSLGASTRLQPIVPGASAAALSIDDAGTVIVGPSNGVAVVWTRTLVNGVFGPWSAAKALESTKALCRNGASIANAVNGAGTVVVGSSCGAAVAWILDNGIVVQRRLLGGLGPPNGGVANGINDLANPIITGEANNGGVYWRTF